MRPIGGARSGIIGSGGNGGSAVPDSDIYLQDDWGDDKLQNRNGSGTTTYNGVTGIYRPKWTLDSGTPQATSQALSEVPNDFVSTDINLNFSTNITWTWTGIDTSNMPTGTTSQWELGCFASKSTRSSFVLDDSYGVQINRSGTNNYISLHRHGTNDAFGSTIIGGNFSAGTNVSITVTRSSGGTWELFVNGNSQGTTTDTTYTTAQEIWFGRRNIGSGATTVSEIKVD